MGIAARSSVSARRTRVLASHVLVQSQLEMGGDRNGAGGGAGGDFGGMRITPSTVAATTQISQFPLFPSIVLGANDADGAQKTSLKQQPRVLSVEEVALGPSKHPFEHLRHLILRNYQENDVYWTNGIFHNHLTQHLVALFRLGLRTPV